MKYTSKKQIVHVNQSSVSMIDIKGYSNIHRNIRQNEGSNRLH